MLQERNLIRSTRQEYIKNTDPNEPQLTPLLYAGVLLEGGIISYDSNIITGGFGARYFGAGGSVKYRQDRVTVYLRMVSTSNGKILNSVYVSKTILSQAVDQSLFRYVNFKRLLEVETGYTTNEPIQMAVTEAIEKAVQSIVLEGIKDGILETNDPKVEVDALLAAYKKENEVADRSKIYNRDFELKRTKMGIEVSGGATLMDGDYSNPLARPFGTLAIKRFVTPSLAISASGTAMKLANKDKLDAGFISFDLNAEWVILARDAFSPFVYGGVGIGGPADFSLVYGKTQFGTGVEYVVSSHIGIKVFAEYNVNFSDNLDLAKVGVRGDNYYKFGIGLNYYFGNKHKN